MLGAGRDHPISTESLLVKSVKIKRKGKSATNRPKAVPDKPSELRGWPAIAQFLGMPGSTLHRWAKEGMPVRREGRNVVASREDLNQWLQRTSGETAGVHVVTPGSDLFKDLRTSVAAQTGAQISSRVSNHRGVPYPVKTPKTKVTRKA